MKDKVKEWVGGNELPFTPKGNMIVNPDSLSKIVHDCIQDLGLERQPAQDDLVKRGNELLDRLEEQINSIGVPV